MSAQLAIGHPIQVQQIQPIQSPQVQVQQPIVVPQAGGFRSPVYQSPVYQSPVYQSPNYYPQPQTPIVRRPIGPVYQAPGTIQTVPPVATRIPQAAQSNQQQLDRAAEQATLDKERISVLEKLLEKYKAIAVNGQGGPAEAEALKQKNAELLREVEVQKQQIASGATVQEQLKGLVEQMKTRYTENETKVQELEQKLAAAGAQDSSGMQEVQKLEAQVQVLEQKLAAAGSQDSAGMQEVQKLEAQVQVLQEKLAAAGTQDSTDMQVVQKLEAQVGDLEVKLQASADENKGYAQQLADAKAAASQLQLGDSEKATLVQQVRELNNTNLGLTQSAESLKQSRDELNDKLSKLEAGYQELGLQRKQAMDDNQKLQGRIAELNASAQSSSEGNVTGIASAVDAPPAPVQAIGFTETAVDVSSFESKIASLTRENEQLARINADFKNQNQSQASPEEPAREVAVSDEWVATGAVEAPAVVAAMTPNVTGKKGGWGTWVWLVPFLAIGLGIAFFVILREEFQRPPGSR